MQAEAAQPARHFRIAPAWRRVTLLLVPPLVALMGWGIHEAVRRYLSGDGDAGVWQVVFVVAVCGTMILVFLAAAVWALRARVILDGDTMTVRGAFLSTVITPARMDGFRITDSQLYVYLHDRRFAVQIGYFEKQWLLVQWVADRTQDIAAAALAEEDAAIAGDAGLGMTDAAKDERLAALHRGVRRAAWAIYVAAAAALANAWFFGNAAAEGAAIAALVLMPGWLDVFALMNRGHVRVDHDEGSRYPQIFTATIVAGGVMTLIAVVEPGAMLDTGRFVELLAIAVLAKGLLWCYIDAERLRTLRRRGAAVFAITLVAVFAMPAFWAGGTLYFANRLLDTLPVTWHAATVVDLEKSTRRVTRYELLLAPRDPAVRGPFEVAVTRTDFEALRAGDTVEVGVRPGAVAIPWVAGLRKK